MAVHQLLHRVDSTEPTAHRAVERRVLLRRAGHWGNLFGVEVDVALEALAFPHTELRGAASDLVLYAHDRPSPLAGRLEHLNTRAAVVFDGFVPSTHEQLEWARAQLAGLGRTIGRGIAPLPSLANVLTVAGFADVEVVPPALEAPTRSGSAAGRTILIRAARSRPDEVTALRLELQRAVAGATIRVLDDGEPGATALDGAAVLISLEESLALDPALLAALRRDVPILAYGTRTAIELLNGSGIVFTEKQLAAVAELTGELVRDERLRRGVLEGQRHRVEALAPETSQGRLAEVVSKWVDTRRSARSRKPAPRPRVAVIAQRFGDVIGGAELHARQVAQHLAPHAELTVLTSCARDHLTWENAYPAGETELDGLRVLRFPTVRARRMASFNVRSKSLFDRPHHPLDEEAWIAEGGPLVPGMLEHLDREGEGYDAFIAFTYLYAPTVWGVPLVSKRALVIPTAHDEPPLRFAAYRDVFERCAALLCNTPEEVALIHETFPNPARTRVVGVGIDPPARLDPERFRRRHAVRAPYLLYVGRVERGKGIEELVASHQRLRRADRTFPDLLLAGDRSIRIEGEGVRHLGRISEEDKWDGLAGAAAVVVPSRWESLSLLTLEAFAVGTPVIANAHSAVLRGQLDRSGGGVSYEDAPSLALAVRQVTGARAELGRRARSYARRHQWTKVIDAYREELERIRRSPR